MHELNNRVKELLERKIEEVINKGDISPSEMCCIKDAYESIYYMQATETMDEYGNESYRGMDSYNMPNWDAESMRRGRGADGRYTSMTNYPNNNRSYHSVNDRIIANLEKELNNSASDYERQRIMEEITRIREMK